MRAYVLVILKPGPNKMAEGQARSTMFKGHFANMGKLAGERKLVLAGPLDGKEGRRGISKPCAPLHSSRRVPGRRSSTSGRWGKRDRAGRQAARSRHAAICDCPPAIE
jgi:hypothetical protein